MRVPILQDIMRENQEGQKTHKSGRVGSKHNLFIRWPLLAVTFTVLILIFLYAIVSSSSPSELPDRTSSIARFDNEDRARIQALIIQTYNSHLLQREFAINSTLSPKIKDSITKKIVCYYNVPSGKNDSQELRPSEIRADLCTHINIAFATVKNRAIVSDERLIETIKEVLELKKDNSKLKVLISIGGAGADGFSDMVRDHASRKIFIRSIKTFLRINKLDGIDLDWEFPGVHIQNADALTFLHRERQHFFQLIREIKMEYIREKKNYLLTVAMAAPYVIVDAAYDVPQIAAYVDFVNVMTYDFHVFTSFTPFTGLNAPLFARPDEHMYMSTLNINYTTHMYIEKGLPKEKIVIGIPTYGHTFRLFNKDNAGIGSPARSYGSVGSLGFVSYPEICIFLQKDSSEGDIIFDEYAKVPYLHKGLEWISFDNRQSVLEKAKFIKEKNLGGAMIYSLNADDFLGECLVKGEVETFPLSRSVREVLMHHDNA